LPSENHLLNVAAVDSLAGYSTEEHRYYSCWPKPGPSCCTSNQKTRRANQGKTWIQKGGMRLKSAG
jgi:hypothetical protein